MPHTGLRSYVVDSAKRICQRVEENAAEQPCSACIWNVSQLHAHFLDSLPSSCSRMTPEALCSMIRSAGFDG